MSKNVAVIYCDNSLYVCGIVSVNDVFFCKHVGCRNDGCAEFMQRKDGNPEFVAALQNKHNHVALLNTGCCKE